MTTSTFVKDIVEQLDETMRLIDEAAEQILGLTGRARNLAALARRYVAEGEADQIKAERMKAATERLDQGIERATQQFIERAEQRLDEQAAGHSVSALLGSVGSVVSSHPAVKAAMVEGRPIRTTEELAALMQENDALGANLTPPADDLHTAYDAAPAEATLVVGVDLGAGEDKAGFFVLDMEAHARGEEKWIDAGQVPPEGFSGGVDDVLKAAYEAPMPEMPAIEISHPLPPPGEEKTEAADVAPQPDEAASVDLIPAAPRDPNTRPTHPGIFLRDDILPSSTVSRAALKHALAVSEATLLSILNGSDRLLIGECHKLGELFGNGADFWLRMQEAYDNWVPPASAVEAAEPEAGQEEASPAEAALSPAEPPPPAPAEEEPAALVAPQFGRDRSHRAAPAKNDLYEEVLALWSTTEKTEMQIARATNSTLALVRQYLEQARLDGDERIVARHKGKLKDRRALKAAPDPSVVDPLHVRDLGPAAQECVDAAIADDVGLNISKGVCVVDLTRNKVIGLKGAHTFREPLMAQTVAKLNDGQMYSVEFLAKECGWSTPDHLKRAITPMMEQLRSIGVVMTSLPVGLTIRVAD